MSSKLKILIADDDKDLLEFMRDVVTTHCEELNFPFQIIEAEDGLDAFGFLQSVQFDLIITDLNMPLLNGQNLIRALRAKRNPNKETPIIIVSGCIDDFKDEPTEGIYFVERPFNIERFGKLIAMRLRLMRKAA